jgi:hypothetical protein
LVQKPELSNDNTFSDFKRPGREIGAGLSAPQWQRSEGWIEERLQLC